MSATSTTFPPETASVPRARHFVRATLDGLGLPEASDAAQLLVSEVATNAVLHARTDFTVEVEPVGDLVRISVRDLSVSVPRPRHYGAESTTGRGLHLVAVLAVDWGVDRSPDGKAVWFEVLAAGDQAAVDGPPDEVAVDTLLADAGGPEGGDGAPAASARAGARSAPAALRGAA